jgi:formylglycine-generating enzyme required for sulfatase activity
VRERGDAWSDNGRSRIGPSGQIAPIGPNPVFQFVRDLAIIVSVRSFLVGALALAMGCGLPSVHAGTLDGGPGPTTYVLAADGGPDDINPQGVAPSCTSVDATKAAASPMVTVPAGAFSMGCNAAVDNECREDEQPPHDVTLHEFQIDKNEVTQAQYFACVQAGACTFPKCRWDPCTKADYPIGCVNRDQAIAYCKWAQKRLPSEAEWEKAARGTDGRKYPWGNEPLDCQRVNMFGCSGEAWAVGSHPENASPYGAVDLAGNVVEWTNDIYLEGYYRLGVSVDPPGPPEGPHFSGRGGGFRSEGIWQRTGSRDKYQPEYTRNSMGIRCAK